MQQTDDLVIWVSLAELGSQPLGEYLDQKWLKEALGLSREEIKADWEQKFKGGAVWLLLDGLDEMSQSDQQALKFRGWVTDARIIVTCRLNLWQANPSQLQGFQTYLTQPFQDEQVQEFIRRWFLVPADAESLWSQLQESGKERIKDLCRNPLRLTLLCATWKAEDALPETTAALYADFVEAIYKWKKEAFPVRNEEKKQLNAALGALAKASLEAETSRFRLTHGLVCEYLGEPNEDSLLDKALRLGWLNEVGVAAENRREKVYSFYHATFQEYFAALAVEDWDYFLPRSHVDSPVEGKQYRIFAPQWKQVILLWFGRKDVGNEEKEEFIQALVGFKDGVQDFYGYQALWLAAAAINEFKACSLATEIVRQVVQWGFGDFNIEKQEWRTFLDPIAEAARKAIPETIRPLAISALIDILDYCPSEDTRRQAAESLGKIDPGNPEAVAALVNLIATTENEYTRYQAAESLGEIGQGNPEAIAALVKVIATTENEYTRRRAAESLGEIGQSNPEAVAALVNLIATTEDEYTRRRAAWSLEKILTTRQQYAGVVSGLKDYLSDFKRFYECYEVIWNCAENLTYPEFYQAWYPEVTEQTPHSGEPSFAFFFTCESLQHLPIYCLNAQLLANETREGEIALILSELIWNHTCPEEDLPNPKTPAELRRTLSSLKRRNLLSHRAILLTNCEYPTPELITFCEKLTGVIAVAFLTDAPLEAPLKGFPPNQPNLLSAIETWLEEI